MPKLRTGQATVFCDANKNDALDTGEASATTAVQGDFKLPSACSATLVSTSGTDISTRFPFKGLLKAPPGSTIISPLTTLLADTGLSNTQLVKMLSLPDGTDLTQADPAAAGNATVMKATLAVQQIVQRLANLMGAINDATTLARLYSIVANAVASTLAASPGATLFAANGTANTTLITAAIQKAVENIAKDGTLKPSL